MIAKKGFLMICLIVLIGNFVSAQDFKYIGADKCRPCHNKPVGGDQYGKWQKDKHSQALKSLSSQASLDYAKNNGIEDPTKDPKCLKCHSTYDTVDPKLCSSILQSEGVSCESCHGPGSAYKALPIMRSHELSLKNGLVVPEEKVCLECHNKENPFFKEFVYATSVAKIAHPHPPVQH